MKLIKQLKLLTFQVIVSLIILNTQISFAQKVETPQITNLQNFFLGVNINKTSKIRLQRKANQETIPIIGLIKHILMMTIIFHLHLQNIFLIKT